MASSDAMSEESVSTMGGLLGGEIIVASVRRVLRYNTGVLASGEYGVLLVTNFRIVFVGAEREEVTGPSLSPTNTEPLSRFRRRCD